MLRMISIKKGASFFRNPDNAGIVFLFYTLFGLFIAPLANQKGSVLWWCGVVLVIMTMIPLFLRCLFPENQQMEEKKAD
ncbi:hypothetical protein [Bacillus swezeyi]|uniref:Uncharacterized protein n=1 Tax=Bacillus swezeyi TaxID=1925020 RepID=A0A5M8RVZ5_9BACI|nr:hypothetical protein [Bacillus swezeyi]KAA6451326.1 hypothetical protein DX927_11155 [Bacillus swezeyi]KAA6482066.1 hypothetical protein DX928_02840 [Bacillus swezeyi]TYS35545.1 hypothetical protein FZC77_10635 [Bacillus swezeyi]